MVHQKWYGPVFCLLACSLFLFASEPEIAVSGTVTCEDSPVEGASVSVVGYPEMTDTTDVNGAFSVSNIVGIANRARFHHGTSDIRLNGTFLEFTSLREKSSGKLQIFSGNGREVAAVELTGLSTGAHSIALPELPAGFYLLSLTVDRSILRRKLINTGNGLYLNHNTTANVADIEKSIAKRAQDAVDTLLVEKEGYVTKKLALDAYQLENVEVIIEKEPVIVECGDFEMPSSLVANSKFPDPFQYIDKTRISRKSEWPCLKKQLFALLDYTHGSLPEDPGEVSASYNNGKLTINVTVNGTTAGFSVNIVTPSGDGPHPAIITLGGSVMSIPGGIGEIQYGHNTVANEGSRTGVFSKLYGTGTSAGAMVMWAWGAGRIIDALEKTEGHNIDPTRIGVTGCSRNGKGAMVIGAYEERIALTLAMEGGMGGISSWRIAEVENPNKADHPDGCQTLRHASNEQGWLSPNVSQFTSGGNLDKTPADAHTLAAVIAPRGAFYIEGSQNSWNCNVCCWTAASAARMVYKALGAETNIGIVMNDHSHCNFSRDYKAGEKDAWDAFCQRFLLGDESVSTDYFKNDGSFDKLIDFDKWIDWEAPELK